MEIVLESVLSVLRDGKKRPNVQGYSPIIKVIIKLFTHY